MVKFNSFLKLIGVCILLTLVSGENNECDTIRNYFTDNENLNVKMCNTNNYGKLISLDLEGPSITQADVNELKKYKSLISLSLFRIYELPKNLNFSQLKLEEIYFENLKYSKSRNSDTFSYQYITKGVLKSLKNVKNVSISGNKISQTTINELGSLSNVEKIVLELSGFDENLDFSPLKNAKKLTELTLSTYKTQIPLSSFPDSLCQLKTLKILNVNYNNFSTIPKCISNLNKLQFLDLYGNNITNLPKEFGKLTNLVELYLMHNKLTSFPSSIGKLSSLRTLDLSFNEINDILPKSLNNLKELKEIYLTENVNIKGKTLTNKKLSTCNYISGNEIIDGLCLDENSICIPDEDIPKC